MMRVQRSSPTMWSAGCTVLMYAVPVVASASCGMVHAQQGGDSYRHQEGGAVAPLDAAIGFVAEVVLPTADLPIAPFKCLRFPSQVHRSNTAQSHHQRVLHCGGIDTTSDGVQSGLSGVSPVGALCILGSSAVRVTVGYAEMDLRGPPAGTVV